MPYLRRTAAHAGAAAGVRATKRAMSASGTRLMSTRFQKRTRT